MTRRLKTALTTLTLCLGMAFMASEARAADPVYNDEGALVDTSGPIKELTFEEGDTLEGEVLRLDENRATRLVDREEHGRVVRCVRLIPDRANTSQQIALRSLRV